MSRGGTNASSRVAVCGIGIVAPGAIGVDAFTAMLRESRSGISEGSRFDTSAFGSHLSGGLGADFRPKDFIAPMKLRRMNTLSRLGLSAAKLAVADSGELRAAGEVGVALGTSFGTVQTSVDYMEEYLTKGAALAPPQLFAESVANAPGSHIAIEFGYHGFNVTFTQRESSALTAAMYASTEIAKGVVGGALAGGVEEMNEVIYGVLDRIGALAHSHEGLSEACRPLDARRNGIVVGEGSATFVLLPFEAAAGRNVYGYLAGFGIARDTSASISNWGNDPKAVERAMRDAIEDAGITPPDVDLVWASANGSIRGDRVEYRAIQSLFGSDAPPVVATKGYFGEYAAAGGLHLASALVAMRGQFVPESLGFERGEDAMTMDVAPRSASKEIRYLLVNSLSAGGAVVSAIIARDSA